MITRAAMIVYRLLWLLLLPGVIVYLFRRGRRDPLYPAHLAERFGFYARPLPRDVIWLHAVSLGETRSATALIRLLLARGERVVLTHFTPAGRRESARLFAPEMASGQLAAVWVPLDLAWCYRRFFRSCRPRIGLTLEIEVWPAMIQAAERAGVPLFMCNAQYPLRSFRRDGRGLQLRRRVMRHLAGAFVKSALQAERFTAIGMKNVIVTGELRFDQPIPPDQLRAGATVRAALVGTPAREIITIASGVTAEEDLYLGLIRTLHQAAREDGRPPPFFVYVPRAPERFAPLHERMRRMGLAPTSRAAIAASSGSPSLDALHGIDGDLLLGDSLGEMFFYLALADRVIVGGGFTPEGAHNIIEPLLMGKPVLTGPTVWPIEYPFAEAKRAGLAMSVPDAAALSRALMTPARADQARITDFLARHAGASQRTLQEIERILHAPPKGATT